MQGTVEDEKKGGDMDCSRMQGSIRVAGDLKKIAPGSKSGCQ